AGRELAGLQPWKGAERDRRSTENPPQPGQGAGDERRAKRGCRRERPVGNGFELSLARPRPIHGEPAASVGALHEDEMSAAPQLNMPQGGSQLWTARVEHDQLTVDVDA